MNGMLVMAEMLSSADLSARHRRYADIIARSGKSLLTIINDILDLSKIESGKLELETVPLSPDALVADVASLFWEKARDKNLELATYVSPDVPAEILGDGTRLNQVITNLVNNALKFTSEGGVVIRVGARVGETGESARMVLEVEDTGIGIPEDKLDHIFEAFSQADQTTTRRFGGTGLGLAVCKRLATAMGGEISVRSVVGKGSIFRMTWPASVHAAATNHAHVGGIGVTLDLGGGLSARWLARALTDLGCSIKPQGDLWLTTSARMAGATPSSAPVVLLSDIGDTGADQYLRDGRAVDVLAQPATRRDLAELIVRAQKGDFRGADALSGGMAAVDRPSFAGLKVLAADDNAVNREVLREALATLGAEAVFVENGAEAVEAVRATRYDLIFMDGSMPVMDGFEATRQIRALEAESGAARTPIQALTAQVAGTDADAWLAAGADGHITKPFTLDRLVSVLSTVEGGGQDPAEPALQQKAETRPQNEVAILDAETVGTLNGLGPAVRAKVWGLFRAKAEDGADAALKLVAASAARAEIASAAHAVKSMALSAGAARFAKACEHLEHAAKDDQVARIELPRIAAQLRPMLDLTLQEMNALESSQAATGISAPASSSSAA